MLRGCTGRGCRFSRFIRRLEKGDTRMKHSRRTFLMMSGSAAAAAAIASQLPPFDIGLRRYWYQGSVLFGLFMKVSPIVNIKGEVEGGE